MAKAKKLGKPKRNRSNFAKRLKLIQSNNNFLKQINIYNKESYGKK
jgi:hypothetical protein